MIGKRLMRRALVSTRARVVATCTTVALVGACSATSSTGAMPASTVVEANATVVDVIDGDTIVVRVLGATEHVRLLGVDAPESVGQRPHECGGKEASALLHALLPRGTRVRLERDLEPRDQYGRLLAYVTRAVDGLFVNLALAEQGAVDVLVIAPNGAHGGVLRDAVATARQRGLGLWGQCGSADVTLAPAPETSTATGKRGRRG